MEIFSWFNFSNCLSRVSCAISHFIGVANGSPLSPFYQSITSHPSSNPLRNLLPDPLFEIVSLHNFWSNSLWFDFENSLEFNTPNMIKQSEDGEGGGWREGKWRERGAWNCSKSFALFKIERAFYQFHTPFSATPPELLVICLYCLFQWSVSGTARSPCCKSPPSLIPFPHNTSHTIPLISC